jgi:hypothetical protein
MKTLKTILFQLSLIIVLSVSFKNTAKAQVFFGIKKINVFADFAFAEPKDAMVNPGGYGLGNAMQLYYGVELPFAYLRYSKKSNMHLSIAAIVDHEKANFSTSNLASDALDAKLTSFGFRARPFEGMGMFNVNESDLHDGKDYTTTEKHVSQDGQRIEFKNGQSVTATEWTETTNHHGWSTAESKGLVYMVLSGLYFDYGFSKAALIEHPSPDVNRSPSYWGWGFAPAIAVGRKTSFYLDLGWRKYAWTNSLNTTSSIKSFRCGFGLGFELNTSKKK